MTVAVTSVRPWRKWRAAIAGRPPRAGQILWQVAAANDCQRAGAGASGRIAAMAAPAFELLAAVALGEP